MTRIPRAAMLFVLPMILVGAARLKASKGTELVIQDEASATSCEHLVGVPPGQNFIHLLSSTFLCTDGRLQMDLSMNCREACGRNPSCNFVSIWWAGGRERCQLTSGCRTKDQLSNGASIGSLLWGEYLQIDVYGKNRVPAGAIGEEGFVWSGSIAGLAHMPSRWVKGKISGIHEMGCAIVQVVEQQQVFETMLGPKPAFKSAYAVSHLQPKPVDSCELGPWKVLQGKEAYRDGDKLEAFFDAAQTDDQQWEEAVFRKICSDGTIGVEWASGDPPDIWCKLPAHVRRAGNLTHFMRPRSIQTCKRWCTEDVNCIGFRAASDPESGTLISCEAIDKNGCFDPESVQWEPWPDKTVDWQDLQFRRARVLAVEDITYEDKLYMNLELAFGGDPFHGVRWEFHWKSDPMNLVTNDLASSGRFPPCRPPFKDYTTGSIYQTHYKCQLSDTVAFRGDGNRRTYNPRTIILNRDGTFDGNMMFIEALIGAWDHLVNNDHLANQVFGLFFDEAYDQLVPIKEWFESVVLTKFFGFLSHAAAHGSAGYLFAKAGLVVLGAKALLTKFMLPLMITYTVTSAIFEHERQMDETDKKIKFVGCNSKQALLFLTPHLHAVVADELRVCIEYVKPDFLQEFQSQVSAVIDAQVETLRRFERISECILSWGWEPAPGIVSDIDEPGSARSTTADCLSNVVLPGLMGTNRRPGLLHSALSLTVTWWQQNYMLLKRRNGARRDVLLQLSRIFGLGPVQGEPAKAPWELPTTEHRVACLGLAASQTAFVEVFNHLAVSATYWVQTFGLYPLNGTIMQNMFHYATNSTVKCAGLFHEYPSRLTAEPWNIYMPWSFCPATRHNRSGDVARFCNGNIDQFRTETNRLARLG